MMIAVPSISGVRRMPIAEFAIGAVAGKLSFAGEWMWHDRQTSRIRFRTTI